MEGEGIPLRGTSLAPSLHVHKIYKAALLLYRSKQDTWVPTVAGLIGANVSMDTKCPDL